MTTFLRQPTTKYDTTVGIVGPVGWPSVDRCCTDVCSAKEKAAFALVSGDGGFKSGKGYNVTKDSSIALIAEDLRVTNDVPDKTTRELMSLRNPSCSMGFLVNARVSSRAAAWPLSIRSLSYEESR